MPSIVRSVSLLTPSQLQRIGAARLAVALMCVVGLIERFQWGLGSITFEPANFFAYLTIQSSIAFAALTATAGVIALRGASPSNRFHALRAGVLTCTMTAGIIFALIVQQSAARGIQVDVPWSDVLLHFVLPLIGLADWLFTPRARVSVAVIVPVVGYVGVWGALTMARGLATGWYPYYFLDPNQTDSIAELLLVCGAAIGVFAGVGSIVVLALPRVLRSLATQKARGSVAPLDEPSRRWRLRARERSRRPQRQATPDAQSPEAG